MALTSLISEITLKLTILDGRDFAHGHRFTKPSFRAKVVVDEEQFVTKASAHALWNEEFPIIFKAKSHLGLEVICKHKKAQDDHTIGVVQTFDVLGIISKPDPEVVDISLLRPNKKSGGSVRITIEVIEFETNTRRRRETASLSWRTLNSTDIIRRLIFDDDLDGLIPPQWACVISSLNVLVDASQDLAELNSAAKVAVGAVCAAIKLINQQIERDEHVKSLMEAISSLYYHMQDTDFEKIKSFELTLRRLVYVTTECAYFIVSYTQKPFGRRIFEGAILGVDDIIAAFIQKFTELRIEFLMGSTLQSTHTVLQVLKEVKNIGKLIHLDHLPLIKNAMWKRMRTELTPEQEKLYDSLTMWTQNADERLVSVLVGDTREDASLIAHKLCERFYGQNRLGSGVFFPDSTGNTGISCELIVSTIARDLAAFHQSFAEYIANVLAKKPRLVPSDDLSGQFEELLIHPLQSLTVTGPLLIVINGLDRCTDHLTFVETLSAPHILGKIPRNVRFLLAFGPQSQPLYPLICGAGSSLRIWHSGGGIQSRIITAAAWMYISKDYQGPRLLDRLEDLKAQMTPVYSRAELEIPPGPYPTITPTSPSLLSEIRWAVTDGRHAAFLEPVLNQARQCVPPDLMARFESYSRFVAIQASRGNEKFHALFLGLKDAVDPEIASWVQEIADTHHLDRIPLAVLDLLPKEMSDYPKALSSLVPRYLNMTLTPNICQFEEIPKLNKDIQDLDDRLRVHVPATLRLLSGCWSEWIVPGLRALDEDHSAALSELQTFLSSHVLSWIELISLLGCADAGLKQLQVLEPVLSQMIEGTNADTHNIESIHSAISDTIRFMIYFRTPIWDGGLFVHRLALFVPTSTFIRHTYAPENVVKSGLRSVDYAIFCPASDAPVLTPLCSKAEIRQVVTKRGHTSFLEPSQNQAWQSTPLELKAHFELSVHFVYIQASYWNHPFDLLFFEVNDATSLELPSRIQEICDSHYFEGIPADILDSLSQDRSDYPPALPFFVLKYLNMTLTPNICQFEEITKLNKDIEDLDHRLNTHVSTTLGLSSQCWAEWIAPRLQTLRREDRRAALSELWTFLSTHLLSWIELISLLGCADAGLKQLQVLEPVLSQMIEGTHVNTHNIESIHSAISDAIRFMIYFREPIQEGGLFVHRLAFLAPTTTFIHRTYAPVNIVKSGLDSDWPYKFSLIPPTPCGQPSTDPVLTSLCHGSIQLRSLETGAHLRTFEVPDDYTGALHKKFLALPGQNHFVFMKEGYVSVFEPDRSLKYLKRKQLKCEGYACSICYTPDRSSLAIRVWEGHLYFQDLATSEIRTYPSFFPRPEGLGEESLLEISLNGHIAAYEGSDSLVVEIYNLAYGPARAMKILEHPSHPLSKKRITDIRWSKDQSHMITIIRPWPPKYTNSSCYLWDMETSNYQELDLGADGSADFGDNGLAILALRAEIHLIDCSTFELKTVIPIYPLHHSMCQRVFGHHGVVMTPLLGGTRGILLYDTSVKSRSSHRFSTSDVLPQAYKDNVFQNSVKHKLRVQDLELVNGWLVMKPDIKLVWIPFPFTYLVKDESMDQITIPNEYDDIRLVLDCKLMEKYLL